MLFEALGAILVLVATIISILVAIVVFPTIGIFIMAGLATLLVAPFAAIDWILRKLSGDP